MFSNLLNTLLGQQTRAATETPEPDAAHALGALLVRVAQIDCADALRDFHAELDRIEQLLVQLHDLDARDAAEMRQACEAMERAAPETEIFTEMIRQWVDFEERLNLLEALWQQELALERRDEARINRVQCALGLSDADGLVARSQALEQV